ncbi:hypothetical protein SK128_014962, partial [Halocaridina rubra]
MLDSPTKGADYFNALCQAFSSMLQSGISDSPSTQVTIPDSSSTGPFNFSGLTHHLEKSTTLTSPTNDSRWTHLLLA